LNLSGNADADTSKHERTKKMHASTASDSPPSHTKISFKTRSSTQEKGGSNEQGKQSYDGAVTGGDPSIKNKVVEKKKPLILHIKKRSTKDVSADAQPLKSEFVGEPSEEKLKKHGSVLKLKKHGFLDLSPNKSKSRRQNSHRDSEKSAAKKVKHSISDDDSVSSTEPSTSLDNSESPPKRKQLDGRTPVSSTKKGKKKVKFVDRKNSEVLKNILRANIQLQIQFLYPLFLLMLLSIFPLISTIWWIQ
jgi:hypothetical protein